LVCSNKGGGPRVSLEPRQRFVWCLPSLIGPKCWVWEGFARELHWTLMLGDCWIGWNCSCASVFFWQFSFKGSVVKLCCLLPSWDTSLMFHGEVRCGECHGSWDLRTSNGGLNLCADEEFAWYSWLVVGALTSGGDSAREVQSPIFQGENPRSEPIKAISPNKWPRFRQKWPGLVKIFRIPIFPVWLNRGRVSCGFPWVRLTLRLFPRQPIWAG
jgi:hypothetical protein